MGKGRNKNKEKDAYSGPSHRSRRDEELSDSGESASTHLTFDDDLRSVQGEDVEDVDSVAFLDSLEEHIENAGHKNISIRMAALRHLQLALTSHYLPEFVMKWKSTLIDIVTKAVKKTDEEIMISALLLALVSLQIGEEIGGDVEELLSILRIHVIDPSKPEQLRGICALSLAVTSHVSSESDDSIAASIKALRSAWASVKVGSQGTRIFGTALPGWALLLQSAEDIAIDASLAEHSKLTAYLGADQLDIRITAGEIIAFIYEFCSGIRTGFRFPNHQQIVDILSGLTSDSSKSKTKRDKRVQRFSFRQIYSSIVDNEPPSVTIKFNRESLVLDSCTTKLFYDLCCEIFHGGMLRQLQHNELIREIFDLGPVPTEPADKINKMARMAFHGAATKYRNQERGKQRDKRNVCW